MQKEEQKFNPGLALFELAFQEPSIKKCIKVLFLLRLVKLRIMKQF